MKERVNLFVYGTLRSAELVRKITGKRFVAEEATLADYQRHELAGTYPFVLPCRGSHVRGLLLRGLDPSSLQALDAYELVGSLYARVLVTVETQAGEEEAYVYVPLPGRVPYRACEPEDPR